ncbi:hypothetical protein J1C56_02240 [Aminobacter anthyllidis]|uniref:Uncharacterized protein n=1 Tax=Aminobacter anthyllidis TaxID=1035067 RepID=A0A9X1A6Z4_9HYPH|nr:hypothetical protein [Aminobacter anthyllidis]MBT1154404.1 hypothetical protein [Aminobacter anthyllidis]
MDKPKITKLITDSIVAAASAIECVADESPEEAERRIKSAYYGLDNALTLVRRAKVTTANAA